MKHTDADDDNKGFVKHVSLEGPLDAAELDAPWVDSAGFRPAPHRPGLVKCPVTIGRRPTSEAR